jgi:hypothetical protein
MNNGFGRGAVSLAVEYVALWMWICEYLNMYMIKKFMKVLLAMFHSIV